MKKKLASVVSILLFVSILSGCGMLTDNTNYNFPKGGIVITNADGSSVETGVFNNKNKSAEVYYDVSDGMKEVVSDPRAQGIIQGSVDAITSAWNDVSIEVYSVGSEAIDNHGISYVNNLSGIAYGGRGADVLTRAISKETMSRDKVIVPRIKLIITDLSEQLNEYQELAGDISDKIIDNNESFAILSVNTKRPFFIFAIGALNDLSDYLNAFYAVPDARDFSGVIDWLGADREYGINCKIYAQNSGIEGIDYDGVRTIENGIYEVDENGIAVTNDNQERRGGQLGVMPPTEQPREEPPEVQPDDIQPEQPNEVKFRTETKGSFNILRPDYRPEDLKTMVEGTVNFYPEGNYINDDNYRARRDYEGYTVELDIPAGVDKNGISTDVIKYFGYKSMLWDKADILDDHSPISGKIKLTVPFKVMPQIQLSNLNFSVATNYSDTPKKNSTEFAVSDQVVKDNIEVSFANNGNGPHTNMWRIDNQDKTAMINIYVKDLVELSKVTKLDIVFGAYDPGTIPMWVRNWTKKDGLENLQNFISLLNNYNTKNNEFSEQLTIYVIDGDKKSYESSTIEPLNET